jgi:putative transposase
MYRRNLPHWHPEGAVLFVTWRLFGTLPQPLARVLPDTPAGRAFRDLDRHLDRAAFGPVWLEQPSIADCVAQTIVAAEAERRICTVHAFVVMPNHVHLLTTPAEPLREVTQWIKGVSARRANQLLNRTGEPFWQDESFDHWIRSVGEFEKIRRYIAQNPVRAGLATESSQWRHSSVGWKTQAEARATKTQVEACATEQE